MKTQTQFTKRDIGIVIDCGSDSADSLNRQTIDLAKEHGFECEDFCPYKSETFKLPAYWASYLINGDASGLDDDDKLDCDEFCKASVDGADCTDVGESYFSHTNDAGTLAGDVADYTFVWHGEENEDYSQELSEAADDAVNFLNELELPVYCSFYFEDNSLSLLPCIENVKEDVGFVSVDSHASARSLGIETDEDDSSYPPADYEGEWLHVNDHGNCTLYVRDEKGNDTEVWSLV